MRQGAKKGATGKFEGYLQPRDKLEGKLRIRQMPCLQKRKKTIYRDGRACMKYMSAFDIVLLC